jgi:hypothetical protein
MPWHRALASGLVVLVGVLGILMTHHPMILSGLQRVQVSLIDTRFNNYVLEHAYRWSIGARNHTEFWNPPFFYPARNVAAYSDLLLSVAPVYMIFRACGLPPDTAMQLWMMTLSALNYVLAYRFLGRRFGLAPPAASVAAFLFAFGAPRINQLGHPQLIPQFFSLVTIDALGRLFASAQDPPAVGKRALLWLAAMLGVVTQLYAGFYLGWFLILALGIAAIVALLGHRLRPVFLATLRRDAFLIAAAGLAGALLLWPLLSHYLAAGREFGPRYYMTVRQFLPEWKSLFYLGPDNWLWGWWVGPDPQPIHLREDEKRIGIGMATTLAAALGLYGNRDRPAVRLLAGVAFGLVIATITVPQDLVQGACLAILLLAVASVYRQPRRSFAIELFVLGLVLTFLKVNFFPTEGLVGAGLFTLLLILADLYQSREEPRRCLVLATLALGFSLWLYPVAALAYGAALGVLVGCLGAVVGMAPRARVGLIALAVLVLFVTVTTYEQRPTVLIVGGLAPLALVVAGPARRVLPPRGRIGMLIVAMLVTLLYRGDDTAWSLLRYWVPGASALHAVARVGLMLLILWSIGLGLFIQGLLARGRSLAALVVGLVCLLEQGVTTPSFDRDEHHRAVAALAERIDRRDVAFFYSTYRTRATPWKYHLDAMWAGLESGVPTINGYSGNFPRRWRPLTDPNVEVECDVICLESALRRWLGEHGVEPKRVGWVGGPAEWRDVPP